MADLVMTQRRFSSIKDGVPLYHLEIAIERSQTPNRADPIDPNVFVFTMGASSLLDVFNRVSTIADMDLLLTSRPDAVNFAHTEFRSSVVVLNFQDLDTAIAAIPVIRDRVNALVTVRNKAIDEFLTNKEQFTMPVSIEVTSVKQGLIDGYTTARDNRVTADASQGAAQDDYDTTQDETSIQEGLTDAACVYSGTLAKIALLATDADEVLSQSKSALTGAMRAATRVTRTLGSHKMSGRQGNLVPEGCFTRVPLQVRVVDSENAAHDAELLEAGLSGTAANRYANLGSLPRFLMSENLTSEDYIGKLLLVSKSGGGVYIGTIVMIHPDTINLGPDAEPPWAEDASGPNESSDRSWVVAFPDDPGLTAEDFYTLKDVTTVSMGTADVVASNDANNVITTTSIPVPEATTAQVPTFSDVSVMEPGDACGVYNDGGFLEQTLRPILGRIPRLIDASQGLKAITDAESLLASLKCSQAQGQLEAKKSAESGALGDLNDKKAASTSAQAAEDTALSGLKEYCPSLDVSTV